MYPDPNRIKERRITIRLDEYEHRLVKALADYQGEQPATLLRQIVMREAASVLSDINSVAVCSG
jgi:uncharacterized protein (DUF1778 family)